MTEETKQKREPSKATLQTRAFRAIAAAKEAIERENAKYARQQAAHETRSSNLEVALNKARNEYKALTGAEPPL